MKIIIVHLSDSSKKHVFFTCNKCGLNITFKTLHVNHDIVSTELNWLEYDNFVSNRTKTIYVNCSNPLALINEVHES